MLNAAPERLWTLLAQTDRINRVLGLPAVSYARRADDDRGIVLRASARQFGMKVEWDEYPFEWLENRFYRVTRRFTSGPIQELHAGISMEPEGKQTCLEAFIDLTPRSAFGALVGKHFFAQKGLNDLIAAAQRLDRFIAGGATHPFDRTSGKSTVNESWLQRAQAAMPPGDHTPVLDKLAGHLRNGFDEEVVGMRPFELADHWGEGRLTVLKLFLHATRAGLLDLQWSVMCPTCGVTKARHGTLRELKNKVHCETCEVTYDATFDQNVEVKFNVNPQVRAAQEVTYCVGGPGNTPHRIAQLYLLPGERRELTVRLAPDRYRFRSYGVPLPARIQARPSTERCEVAIACAADGFTPQVLEVGSADTTITLENRTDGPRLAILEPETWQTKAATAALVTSLQEFRDLFSSEALAPGEEIAIRSVTVMFTDLKSSTSLYEEIGDTPAYGLVRAHFEFLMELIAKHNGAIVKTIGDAVMAVFLTGREGVACALEIQREVAEFNRTARNPIVIKLGLHRGPAIVINANEKIDYFGTTVNLAARVQNESVGGDIMLTPSLYESPEIAALAVEFGAQGENLETALRGLSGRFALQRLRYPVKATSSNATT